MTDDYSHAELVRLVKGLEKSFTDFRAELRADIVRMEGAYITRSELAAWQTAYDREIVGLRSQLGEVKDATLPVRTSPWQVVATVVGAVVGLGSLLALVVTLIQIIP